VARVNSLPAPRARPRMAEIVTAGSLLSRIRTSSQGWKPVGPRASELIRERLSFADVVMRQKVVRVGAVEDYYGGPVVPFDVREQFT
jgi:hypothetical protein